MKPENAIEVHNVSKAFKVYLDKGLTMKERVIFKNRRKFENRQVLDHVSFEVKKGEAVGLIGHNGCGKSTTLKLLTRIMYPDSGTIEMEGRVSSLIELGAGFHPDMSGRENIYINASIFGLTKKEIDERLDDIIAFSELEEFIENPVRTYSSGMYMRLAFAVAINVDADILLIDEILAVGDASFQAKCFDKMREIKASGTTIVLVSHSLGQVEQICDRSIWIHEGKIRKQGDPSTVDYAYLEFMGKRPGLSKKTDSLKAKTESKQSGEEAEEVEKDKSDNKETEKDKPDNKKIEILGARLLNEDGQEENRIRVGNPFKLEISYKMNEVVPGAILGLKLYRNDNVIAYGTNTQIEHLQLKLSDEGKIVCKFPKTHLITGRYYLDIAFREANMMICDYQTKIITFDTYYPIPENGIVHLEHEWLQLG